MSPPETQNVTSTVTKDAPIPRHELTESVHQEIDRLLETQYPKLASIQADIHTAADVILNNLPKKVGSGNVITRRCKKPADAAIIHLSKTDNETDTETQEYLSDLRKNLCAHVMLTIKKEHIQRIIAGIQLYQSKHTPVPWTIASVRRYDETTKGSKLYTFTKFWQSNIEEEGDAIFRKYIVSKLSPEWQEKFVSIKSPHRWSTMGNKEIADKISPLKTKRDPAKSRWNFSSIQAWEGEDGESLGRGFSDAWKRKYKLDYEEKFRELILPHLPEKWRENYVSSNVKYLTRKGPYIWPLLSAEETVDALISLKKHRNPERAKWSFGSVVDWTGEDGERLGMRFYGYLRNKYGAETDKKFREIYLPHFPPMWRETYLEKKYKITFVPSSSDSEAANEEDNLDKLVALAQKGNHVAYEKALPLAIKFLAERFSNTISAPDFIERLMHIHLPALGSFKAYLIVSAMANGRVISHARSMDEKSHNYDRGLGVKNKGGTEDALLEKLEPPQSKNEALIDALQELELSPSFLELLSEEILAGRSLDQLMEHEDPQIADAARKVTAVLALKI